MTMQDIARLFPDMGTVKGPEMGSDGSARYVNYATCPAHDDGNRSLEIKTKTRADGQITGLWLRCHAGCATKDIVDMAGLPSVEEMIRDLEKDGRTDPGEEPGGAAEPAGRAMALGIPDQIAVDVKRQIVMIHQMARENQALMEIVKKAGEQMQAMGEMMRVTNEQMAEQGKRMAEMEKVIRTLEKVTPLQGRNINKAIRERSADICMEYRLTVDVPDVWKDLPDGSRQVVSAETRPDPAKVKIMSAAIRKAVSEMTGARTMREIARCDYDTVIAFVMDWEDYDEIQRIRKRK